MAKTNIVHSLKLKCTAAGTNLTEVCRKAGVNRQTVERWKKEEPKTLTILRQLEEAIELITREKATV